MPCRVSRQDFTYSGFYERVVQKWRFYHDSLSGAAIRPTKVLHKCRTYRNSYSQKLAAQGHVYDSGSMSISKNIPRTETLQGKSGLGLGP